MRRRRKRLLIIAAVLFCAAGVALYSRLSGTPRLPVVRRWNIRTSGAPSEGLTRVIFSPDGSFVIGSDGWSDNMRVWDARTGKLVHEHGGVSPGLLAISPDGALIASRPLRYTVGEPVVFHVWQTESGELVRSWRDTTCSQRESWFPDWLEFGADGETLICVDDNAAHFWNVKTGSLRRTLEKEGLLIPLPGGVLAELDSATFRVWADEGSRPVRECELEQCRTAPEVKAGSWRCSANAEVIFRAAKDATGNTDDVALAFWDARSGKLLSQRSASGSLPLNWAAFAPDGRTMATGGLTRSFSLLGWVRGLLPRKPGPNDPRWRWRYELRVLDVPTGTTKALTTHPLDKDVWIPWFSGRCRASFSPDGKFLVGSVGNEVIVWDVSAVSD